MECTEPGCRYPATRDWKGKKVCQDHWEKYKDAEDRMNAEMADSDW